MFKPLSYSMIALAVLVAGCSSGVKLQDPNATGTSGAIPAGEVSSLGTDISGPSGSSISGIDLTTASQVQGEGPANITHTIYFDFDSYSIRPDFQSVLQAHADFLRANRTRVIMLEGHTDERGGREYNLALGQKRAEAVRQALDLLGVPANSLEPVSYGKEKPAVTGYDENAYSQNRRVEIRYNLPPQRQ